ncbi:MAG: hypothetical protein ACM3N5_12440, partial [Candidatus Eiseniibacteriota bacterium]
MSWGGTRTWLDRVARGSAPRRTLLVLGAAVSIVFVGTASLSIYNQYQRILASARLATEKEAGMLAEHTGWTLGAVDVALRTAVGALEAAPADTPRAAAAALGPSWKTLMTLPQVRGLAVFDATGAPVFTWPVQHPWAPETIRPLLDVERTLAPSGPYMAARHERTVLAKPTILITRAYRRPDGSFAGIVVADVELLGMEDLRSAAAHGGGALAIWSDDGQLLAHYPSDDTLIGREAEQAIFSRQSNAATFTLDVDRPRGEDIILSFRHVAGLPLTATSALDRDDAMADWDVVLRNHAAAVVLVVGTLLALTMLLLGQMAR